jgi:hypothetical protein
MIWKNENFRPYWDSNSNPSFVWPLVRCYTYSATMALACSILLIHFGKRKCRKWNHHSLFVKITFHFSYYYKLIWLCTVYGKLRSQNTQTYMYMWEILIIFTRRCSLVWTCDSFCKNKKLGGSVIQQISSDAKFSIYSSPSNGATCVSALLSVYSRGRLWWNYHGIRGMRGCVKRIQQWNLGTLVLMLSSNEFRFCSGPVKAPWALVVISARQNFSASCGTRLAVSEQTYRGRRTGGRGLVAWLPPGTNLSGLSFFGSMPEGWC